MKNKHKMRVSRILNQVSVYCQKSKLLTRTTMVQHETRNTTIMKMTSRTQELPIITSPGPSLPFGHLNPTCLVPVKCILKYHLEVLSLRNFVM